MQRNFSAQLEAVMQRYGAAHGSLAEAARYHLSRPGKRNRAHLLHAVAGPTIDAWDSAVSGAACELVHEASIVHDDLQDLECERRGQLPVWQAHGEDAALLLGDHLIACAFRVIANGALPSETSVHMLALLAEAVSRAASGQHLQLVTSADDVDLRKTYELIARRKTGALIALPLQFAGVLRGLSHAQVSALGRCGEYLGLAYQILDDLSEEGDGLDADLKNGVATAVIVEAKAVAPGLDPFQLLTAGGLPREQIRQRCRFWLARATGVALEQAALLPEDMRNAVRRFVEQGLQAPGEAVLPLALESGYPTPLHSTA